MGVALERDQVVKGVDLAQLGRVDQAHEDVADARAVLGLEKEGVLSVKDRLLEGSFANVVIDGLQRSSELTRVCSPKMDHPFFVDRSVAQETCSPYGDSA